MDTKTLASTLFVAGTLLSAPSHARPFRTDAAGTTAPAAVEVELGSDYWSDRAGFGLNIKQGLTPRLDLGFHIPYTAIPDTSRAFGAATVSAKFDLIPSFASVAFTSELGGASYVLNGALTKAWGPFKGSVDLGGHFVSGQRDADLSWGVNPSWTSGRFTLGAELRGDQHEADWWQVGAQAKLASWIALDAGLGDDFSDGHDWQATTGLWIALPAIR